VARTSSSTNKSYEYDKTAYNDERTARCYEQRSYYRGALGWFRKYRERQAIHSAVQQFMRDSVVLDCPCGNGRWFDKLATRANRIIGVDSAEAMIQVASERQITNVELDPRLGDATQLDMDDDAVEHVFSYALMKHVPHELKVKILREFARVSTGRIAVSFGVFTPLSFLRWKLRGSPGYQLWPAEVERLAADASLRVGASYHVGLPAVGMERLYVFER